MNHELGGAGSQLEVTTTQDLDLFDETPLGAVLPRVNIPKGTTYCEKMAPRSDYGTGGSTIPCAAELVCAPSLAAQAFD